MIKKLKELDEREVFLQQILDEQLRKLFNIGAYPKYKISIDLASMRKSKTIKHKMK